MFSKKESVSTTTYYTNEKKNKLKNRSIFKVPVGGNLGAFHLQFPVLFFLEQVN